MSADFSQRLQGLTDQQGTLLKTMEDILTAMEEDGADRTALKASLDEVKADFTKRAEERAATERDAESARLASEILELRESMRTPSKAHIIGNGRPGGIIAPGDDPEALFFWSVWAARNTRSPEFHAIGKANLDALGSYWAPVPEYSKATLGTTAATGGNIIPPNVLGELIPIAVEDNPFRRLMPFQNVGSVSGVDVPTSPLAPTRAVVVGWGDTKPTTNLTYGKYTATMYTIARIADVANQLLRNSRGVAEADVRRQLSEALNEGEAYYILQGSGSSEPYGILTAIGTSGTFVSTFSSPSDSTVAGSGWSAISTAAQAIANRARRPDGVVVNAGDFWQYARQGSDTAGFWLNTNVGPLGINPMSLELRAWGLPVYGTTYMPTDNLVVGEWRTTPVYQGESVRIDVSDVAGTRWDTNVTGFRIEEEIGFTAVPYVAAGKFQRILNSTA